MGGNLVTRSFLLDKEGSSVLLVIDVAIRIRQCKSLLWGIGVRLHVEVRDVQIHALSVLSVAEAMSTLIRIRVWKSRTGSSVRLIGRYVVEGRLASDSGSLGFEIGSRSIFLGYVGNSRLYRLHKV